MDGGTQFMSNSFQNKLLVWLGSAIILVSLLASAVSFLLSYNEAQNFQDDGLHQISLLVETYKKPLDKELILESKESDSKRIVVQPVISSPNVLPSLLKLPANLSSGYQTVKVDGLYWRVYVYANNLGGQAAVAQEVTVRKTMARKSALLILLPLLAIIPILILVLRRIIRAEMSPLSALAEIIDTQNEGRLSELPTNRVPDEVAPFIHAINRLLQRINLMNESQRRFIANAAHELRSPLTALSLQAQNIEKTGSYAISKERLVPLKVGLERSRHLLNQLLDLVRQQASATNLLPVDLAAVAVNVIEEMMPIADAKKIDLGLSQEATVRIDADPSAIQLLLRNAVDNALRYTPEGGEVTVRIGSEDDNAIIQVIDNGPGIPDAELKRVFDAFYRLPGNTQVGSGLGLAIARSIADQFKGSITLSNRPSGTGLIFTYCQRQSQAKH
jgi:two-component system OmpR family sensor kinase/two-component system sensor histidine kinase QseC